MNSVVLDASAILAIINQEAGYEKLSPDLLSRAVASTVNIAEVQAKLVTRGWLADEAWEDAVSPIREIIDFTEQHARIAGGMAGQTKPFGLSLGDRACLALGVALKTPVYTAERSWKKLKLDLQIQCIR